MFTRAAAFLGLSLVFVAGTLALAQRITLTQVPADSGAFAQATPSDMAPPAQIQLQPAPPAPTVIAPSMPAPVVSAPPAEAKPEAPATSAAPTDAKPATTAPVVVAPPVETKPVEPTPVVTAPPAAEPAPTSAPAVASPVPMPPHKPAAADKPDNKKQAGAAKTLFAAKELPSIGKALAIGYYPKGCLQGGVELPVNGPTWQVMRLSRNRNWGHPSLVKFLERFAPSAAKATGWHGILIGDMAQPRGGPLPFGHTSHQIGLDVDIWFVPMPERTLSAQEREKMSANNLVAADWKHINPKVWTPQHADFIRTAAEQPEVERVLVNAAIKKEMCRMQGSKHPAWMDKVRPWYGHHDHIHVRLKCPADSPNCRPQPAVPDDAQCSDKSLAFWFSDKVLHPKPRPANAPPPKGLTMADLPPACQTVLNAPARDVKTSKN